MSPASSVLAPNVYLFAYQLCQRGKDDPFWTECDRLFKECQVSLSLRDKLDPDLLIDTQGDSILLLQNGKKKIDFQPRKNAPEDRKTTVSGYAQPSKIQDSYCLLFNLGYDDNQENLEKVSVDDLRTILKPNSILHHFTNPSNNPDKPRIFLGNTLIFTAYIPSPNKQRDPNYLQSLADSCLTGLFNPDELKLYESGELFGNSIFAYENRDKTDGDRHVLIWLFRDEQADDAVNQCLPLLRDLLFYRTKIAIAYADSRLAYQGLSEGYEKIEQTLNNLQKKLDDPNSKFLSKDDLKNFKIQIKDLTKESLPYRRFLRKMDDFCDNIETNLKNYNQTLDEISQTLEMKREELVIFHEFAKQTAPYYQDKIKTNFRYFADGTELVDRAIATIRTLVEIEQAESDRTLQQQNEDLQDDIQALGFAIGVGAILASTSSLITEDWYWPNRQEIVTQMPPPHPFIVAFFGSIGLALFAFACMRCLLKNKRNRSRKESDSTEWESAIAGRNRNSAEPSGELTNPTKKLLA